MTQFAQDRLHRQTTVYRRFYRRSYEWQRLACRVIKRVKYAAYVALMTLTLVLMFVMIVVAPAMFH